VGQGGRGAGPGTALGRSRRGGNSDSATFAYRESRKNGTVDICYPAANRDQLAGSYVAPLSDATTIMHW
jgi:hypothetical protein